MMALECTRDTRAPAGGYTTNFFYRDLNNLLLDASEIDKTSGITKLLNQALSKLPDFKQNIIYRGIVIQPNELDEFLKNYNKGIEHSWKGFTSCGSSKDASFIKKAEVNVVFEIKHLDGKDISDFADGIKYRNMSPSEILIKNNGTYISLGKPYFDTILGKYKIILTQIK